MWQISAVLTPVEFHLLKLTATLKSLLKARIDDIQCVLTIVFFDRFKDGVITFDEFINAVAISSKGTIDEKLDWAFSIYDIDDDGYITQEEMLNIVRAVYERKGMSAEKCNIAQQKVEQIFIKMDTNSDGKLSRVEFIDGFKNDPQILRSLVDRKSEET